MDKRGGLWELKVELSREKYMVCMYEILKGLSTNHVCIKIPRRVFPGMVMHASSPSTQDAEAGGSLSAGGQTGLHSEFQQSQSYTGTLSQKKKMKSNHYLPESFQLTGSM